VHDTPTDASSLNQVERWFGIVTQRAICRGSFCSVKELIAKIEQFVAAYNKSKAPFNWTDPEDSILENLQRLCSQISGTAHEGAVQITCSDKRSGGLGSQRSGAVPEQATAKQSGTARTTRTFFKEA
jgi:hypothetical protein